MNSVQPQRYTRHRAVIDHPPCPLSRITLEPDIGEQHNIANNRPEIIAQVEKILAGVRTDADVWPLNGKKGTVPF